jgi:hypothetical protein
VKQPILLILIGALIGGGAVWLLAPQLATHKTGTVTAPGEKPATEEEPETTISHDANGNVVIGMSDDKQGDAGILVANPVPAQFSPEIKGYGRILDPAPLVSLINELAAAQAASAVSSNELARQKILAPQGNASPRAIQAAEAASIHDELVVQSARDRLVLAWGKELSDRKDLPEFLRELTGQQVALVRINIPGVESWTAVPLSARIVLPSGESTQASYLGLATDVDAQVQGRGFIFLVQPNPLRLFPGQGLIGYLKMPGEPVSGVNIPRDAVIRSEGKGWVYVMNAGGEALTRKEIPLDRPTTNGWFVANGITSGEHIVVTGAQTLLSEELKAAIKSD